MVIAGGLVFVAALPLLDWFGVPKVISSHGVLKLDTRGSTLWDFRDTFAGSLTVLAAGTVALAATSLLSSSVITALPALCGSIFLLGETFPVGASSYSDYRVGFWLASSAALTMSAGAVVAAAGRAPSRPSARPS